MQWDYGYMEDGKLGKPYNLRLLRRLSGYAVPYLKILFLALLLSVLITAFELAVPYLSKIAIDRYIVSSWYKISLVEEIQPAGFQEKYSHILIPGKTGTFFIISQQDFKKVDPAQRHGLQSRGLISEEAYYRVPPPSLAKIPVRLRPFLEPMADGSVIVRLEKLHELSAAVSPILRSPPCGQARDQGHE